MSGLLIGNTILEFGIKPKKKKKGRVKPFEVVLIRDLAVSKLNQATCLREFKPIISDLPNRTALTG